MLLLWFPWNLKKIENHGFYNTGEITNHNVAIETTTKGGCLNFTGSQWLHISNFPIGSFNTPLTISWWHYQDNVSQGCICSSRTDTGKGLSVFNLSGTLRFDNGNNTTESQMAFSSYALPTKTWHHYTMVQNETQRLLYVDGILTQTIGSAAALSGNTAQAINIGASAESDGNPSGNFMRGNIGDLRIYNEALSADRIAKLAAGALSAPPPCKITNNQSYGCRYTVMQIITA